MTAHVKTKSRIALLAAGTILAATPVLAQETVDSSAGQIAVRTVADGLVHPWGIAVLPDGAMLVTERPGRMRIVSPDGSLSEPLQGVPEVDARDQGGLLDVTLHPDFAENRWVYFTYSEPGEGGTTSTAAARGKLNEERTALTDVETVFVQKPKVASTKHYGSRLVFDGEGHVFIGLGERFAEQFRTQAQDLDSHLGKVVRVNEDGSVPDDNPFVGRDNALPEIWSYGHRNIQAMAMHPERGELWEIEHGPKGGDELNIAEAGKNYGWPVVSYGVNYDGSPVGSGKEAAEGFVEPILQWTPVIAPSGMMFYDGDLFADWKGDLFVGGLASKALVRVETDGATPSEAERLLESLGSRFRDVVQGPEGEIIVITDADNGKILELTPAD